MGRKVLQVARGEVAYWLQFAQDNDFPEIEERDDVAPGDKRELEEPDSPTPARDWAKEWQALIGPSTIRVRSGIFTTNDRTRALVELVMMVRLLGEFFHLEE